MTQNNEVEIKSFLKIEFSDSSNTKNLYQNIPTLLYALLIVITDERGADEIKISGLNI